MVALSNDSQQVVATPRLFLDAVEKRFGKLEVDLACTRENIKAPCGLIEGEQDSLRADWGRYTGLCWLNPPYRKIAPWAKKCAEHGSKGTRILMLVPASIGANWYWDNVHDHAVVVSVGRMIFDGHAHMYPKDLMLCCYGPIWLGDVPFYTAEPAPIERWTGPWNDPKAYRVAA